MSPNPIVKVLSSIRTHGVQGLLIGGQACILYGAAEFSRDLDAILLLSPENLDRFRTLLGDLDAHVVAVPPFDVRYLDRGHFVHFRCGRGDVSGVRIDVACRLRGVAPFGELWERRRTMTLADVGVVEVIALTDLVASKKTQRDKDWVMLRRLLEVDYFADRAAPAPGQIDFWLCELRTPELLVALACLNADRAAELRTARPLLTSALADDAAAVERELAAEMERERAADREYWAPLRRELMELRRGRRP